MRRDESGGSMVEMLLLTILILLPIVFGGIFIVSAIVNQGKAAQAISNSPSQSSCIVNITTNACSK